MQWIEALFTSKKPVIGVIHLLPLPGSPRYGGNLETILRAARTAANTFWEAGFDGVMLENFCDVPFFPDHVDPHVVALAGVLVKEFRRRGPCGVNLLRNAARDAMAAAFAGGGDYIRVNVHSGAAVTDQGLLTGKAYETVRYRSLLGAGVRILADVHVKHAEPLVPRDPVEEALDCVERGLADGIIATGPRTGVPADLSQAEKLKAALPATPLFLGSGVSVDNVAAALRVADGIIVSTSLESETGVVDQARAKAFMEAARKS